MAYDRRTFLRLAVASASTAALSACAGGGGGVAPVGAGVTPGPTTPPPPAPAPTPPPASTPLEALRDFVRTHATPGLSLPAASSTPPIVSWAGALTSADPATTLPDGRNVPITDAAIGGPLRDRWAATLAGSPTVAGLPCLRIERTYTASGVARSVSSPGILRFRTDAPVVEIGGVLPDGGYTSVTLLVDGERVDARALSSGSTRGGGWNAGAIRIDFGTRRSRDVWVESQLACAYVRIASGDSLTPAADASEPQLTVVGDSYLQQHSGTYANGGAIALSLGARLGIHRVATDAIGGTGYQNSGRGVGNLLDRVGAHAADRSAIYLVMAGLNDYGDLRSDGTIAWGARADYEFCVTEYLRRLRAARPDALIVVTAPFCPVPPQSDSTYVANAAVNDSGRGDFLYRASVHEAAVRAITGPWVYVDVLMGTGWVNSSGARGDATNLQWFTGGTPGPGTTATNRPGNTLGGGGGGFGGLASVPVLDGGRYRQAPDVRAIGGSGSGAVLTTSIDRDGALRSIAVVCAGAGWTSGSLPTIEIDRRFEISAATLGTPALAVGTNADGQYPLPEFAPPGATPEQLNNIYTLLSSDRTHPSPLGVEYVAGRLARSIYDALLAL